jgi:hypothetical protein
MAQAQASLKKVGSAETSAAPSYTAHLCPPVYPKACFPARCKHEPQFAMHADLRIVKNARGRNQIEIDHAVCLACGATLPCTLGGNVLVDLQMLWQRFGFNPQIGARILTLRQKWGRIATYLFNENGWTGRHERIARMIDPHLTMKLRFDHDGEIVSQRDWRVATVSFDASYLREAA